jgi:hypothetical protein
MTQQKDNGSFEEKAALRRQAVDILAGWGVDAPLVMETHGGNGALFDACYAHVEEGVVFEKDALKTATLGKQRPTWAVYEADCVTALELGVGKHWVIDLLDVDPYGAPWDVLRGFFESERPLAERMVVVVNDGLRQKLASGSGWEVKALEGMVMKYGNDLHPIYLDICKELLGEVVANAGYRLERFHGYYCGHSLAMTHYLGVLVKDVEIHGAGDVVG